MLATHPKVSAGQTYAVTDSIRGFYDLEYKHPVNFTNSPCISWQVKVIDVIQQTKIQARVTGSNGSFYEKVFISYHELLKCRISDTNCVLKVGQTYKIKKAIYGYYTVNSDDGEFIDSCYVKINCITNITKLLSITCLNTQLTGRNYLVQKEEFIKCAQLQENNLKIQKNAKYQMLTGQRYKLCDRIDGLNCLDGSSANLLASRVWTPYNTKFVEVYDTTCIQNYKKVRIKLYHNDGSEILQYFDLEDFISKSRILQPNDVIKITTKPNDIKVAKQPTVISLGKAYRFFNNVQAYTSPESQQVLCTVSSLKLDVTGVVKCDFFIITDVSYMREYGKIKARIYYSTFTYGDFFFYGTDIRNNAQLITDDILIGQIYKVKDSFFGYNERNKNPITFIPGCKLRVLDVYQSETSLSEYVIAVNILDSNLSERHFSKLSFIQCTYLIYNNNTCVNITDQSINAFGYINDIAIEKLDALNLDFACEIRKINTIHKTDICIDKIISVGQHYMVDKPLRSFTSSGNSIYRPDTNIPAMCFNLKVIECKFSENFIKAEIFVDDDKKQHNPYDQPRYFYKTDIIKCCTFIPSNLVGTEKQANHTIAVNKPYISLDNRSSYELTKSLKIYSSVLNVSKHNDVIEAGSIVKYLNIGNKLWIKVFYGQHSGFVLRSNFINCIKAV